MRWEWVEQDEKKERDWKKHTCLIFSDGSRIYLDTEQSAELKKWIDIERKRNRGGRA